MSCEKFTKQIDYYTKFNGYNFENFRCRIIWNNLLFKSFQSKMAMLDYKESKGTYKGKNQFMYIFLQLVQFVKGGK